ncbi:MAG: hypothetical protein HQK54_08100 [Oligoflexales bacterium]|nr:hypothetical protein [Oligoflexales bacterium]
MAKSSVSDSYQEGLSTFYLEKLCGKADLVFRFGFALTLNRDGASECVYLTYKKLSKELSEIMKHNDTELRIKLLNVCWEASKYSKTEYPVENSGFAKFLMTLDQIARGSLIAVDVEGLTPSETAEIFGLEEMEIRKHLATGRKALIEYSP